MTTTAAPNASSRSGDPQAGLELLDRAAGSLVAACRADTTTDRYVHAHLGALRAAAALLVMRPLPAGRDEDGRSAGRVGRSGRGGRVVRVWDSLRLVAPEFAEWADYLALAGTRRLVLEGGGEPAGLREADDLLRAAETFLSLVRAALGLPVVQVPTPLAVAGRA